VNSCKSVRILILAIFALPSCLAAPPLPGQTPTPLVSSPGPTSVHATPSPSQTHPVKDIISPSDADAFATLAFDLTHPSSPWPTFTPTPTCEACPSLCSTQTALSTLPTSAASRPSYFVGLRFPPLPAGFQTVYPLLPESGETEPGYIPHYFVFLVQYQDVSMLWLAIIYKDGGPCEQYRVADAVLLPSTNDQSAVISTLCLHGSDLVPYAVALAIYRDSEEPVPPTLAWRVDTSTDTIIQVNTDGLLCYVFRDSPLAR
jgi:hypothetical protein